jgi:hypothetical protein
MIPEKRVHSHSRGKRLIGRNGFKSENLLLGYLESGMRIGMKS